MAITLEDLKNRPLNEYLYRQMYETWTLGDKDNIRVYRHRIRKGTEEDIKTECYDFTHHGNSLMCNDEMLDRARCFYEDKIYTDEEWEKYFLPAINKAIEENDHFERWYPGYLIKNKSTGKLAIVKGDYAYIYGGRNYTSLYIYDLDENGGIISGWAWADYDNYELVDTNHIVENFNKIGKYED